MIKWTICICTVTQRRKNLERLMEILLPQVEEQEGKVEVLVFFNNFEFSMGFLRQSLIEEARGEYVTHVDDDDEVPEDYVSTLLPLMDGVDYIGFKVKFIDKGQLMKPVYHSLKYTHWYQDDTGYYRGVTHLNPIKRSLALTAGFPLEYNIGEDEQFANRVKAKTEHFVDKEMYIYHHSGEDSMAYTHYQTDAELGVANHKPSDTPIRPNIKSKYVRFHPRSTK